MNCITICQPYPFLICLPASDPRHKRVENRVQFYPWNGSVGERIAIHAGKSKAWLRTCTILTKDEERSLVYGKIVATAMLVAVYPRDFFRGLDVNSPLGWVNDHMHAEGPYCLILADVKPVAVPIDWIGSLGFSVLPKWIEEAVNACQL